MQKLGCFLVLGAALCMYGQSDRGTITGTVSDPAGAMIPSAAVVATNPETGVEFRTQTTSTGNYTIPNVPSGTYDVNVEMSGFRKYQQKGVGVQVATTSRVDIVMQVGSTGESVTVTAEKLPVHLGRLSLSGAYNLVLAEGPMGRIAGLRGR